MYNFSCGFIGLNTLRYMCLVLFSERFLSRMFPNMVKYCFISHTCKRKANFSAQDTFDTFSLCLNVHSSQV